MTLYQQLAEKLQFIIPQFYKKRYFKNLINLTKDNFSERNVEPELVWINNYLPKEAVVFDIGANVGTFLFQLEKHINPTNIYAFEPNKNLFERLKRIFKNVAISPVALSDENTTAKFKIPIIKGEKVASRGTLNTNYKEVGEEESQIQVVEVIKLDDWMSSKSISRVDFIKIDVEGNELKTLKGGKKTILKFLPTLMVEMEQRHHQEPVWDGISEIINWGYEALYLDRNSFILKNLNPEILIKNTQDEKNKKEYINNIIFIPKKA